MNSAMIVYYLIELVMFLTGLSLLVHTFMKVKNPLFQMFFVVIGLGLVGFSVALFFGVSV
jgi:hypothetical protein